MERPEKNETNPRPTPAASIIPAPKQLLFAAIAIGGFFVLLEAALWLAGVEKVARDNDPYVGFSSSHPLFIDAEGPGGEPYLRTAPNKQSWFNPIRFPRDKADGVYRVFSLGGSTTHGRPYTDTLSFSGWLREYLPLADPSRQWQVLNAGGISYASYRITVLMEELAQYEPDLFIVYTGHNEFLERRTYPRLAEMPRALTTLAGWASHTRLYAAGQRLLANPAPKTLLDGEVNTILERSVGPEEYHRDDALRQQVFEHFRYNLNRMVDIARASGAAIVFVTPASNLAGCSPFKSEPSTNAAELDALLDAATSVEDWTAAVAVDPRYAESHYRLGLALLEAGRYDEAEAALARAVEEDVCPLRAPREIERAVAEVARARSAPLVDFAETIRRRSPHRITASEHSLDHVHLNAEGYSLLAREIVAALARSGILQLSEAWSEANLESVRQAQLARLDRKAYGESLLNLGKVYAWAGKHEEAGRFAREAGQILGGDPEVYRILGHLASARGDLDDAVDYLTQAVRLEPDYAAAQHSLGTALYHLGRYEQAAGHFAKALDTDPIIAPEARNNLGLTLEALGRRTEAIDHYRQVLTAKPDHVDARNNLGAALLSEGTPGEAIPHFRQVLALDPNRAEAHFNLGAALEASGSLNDAVASFEQAIHLRPGYPEAHNSLGLNLILLGRSAEAIQPLEEAIRLRPGFPEAHDNLGSALRLTGQPEAASAEFDEAIRLRENWAPPILHKAQLLIPTNPAEAVRLATRAAQLTNHQDQDVLDVLAEAKAANQ